MPLTLTDEQALLQDSARGFLAAEAPVSALRALRDSRDPTGFSRDLWRAFAEMGFTGVLAPEAQGGLGLGCVEAGVISEEIGRNLTASPFLSTAVLATTALNQAGSAVAQSWLGGIVAGDVVAALAVDEGAKHDSSRIALKAARSGNGFRLEGQKAFVMDGHVADLLIVAARTAGAPGEVHGLTLFALDPRAPGLSIERTQMVDSRNAARIRFEGVAVDADSVLGEVDLGAGLLERVLDVGRACVAAELVGLGDEAFGRTVTYLKERRQFGRLIGEFQALQHRAARVFTETAIARAAVLKALQSLDAEPENAAAIVSVAKAKAGQAAQLAVREAVQMHGGVGMTDALDIGFFMKRARVAEETFGDAAFHADRLARAHGY